MRAAGLAMMLALSLTACSAEPSFDERYASTEKSLRNKAAAIDAELAERERQAREAAPTSVDRPVSLAKPEPER